jgi:hypothetical protein
LAAESLRLTTEEILEHLGPCTRDVKDCEIMRAAIVLQEIESDLSAAIGKAVCDECRHGE